MLRPTKSKLRPITLNNQIENQAGQKDSLPFPFIIIPDLRVEGDGPGNKVNPALQRKLYYNILIFNDTLKLQK